MKRCPECSEEFEDKFNFCRADGTPLVIRLEIVLENSKSKEPPKNVGDYYPTFLDDEGLWSRFWSNVAKFVRDIQASWPEFKKAPIDVTKDKVMSYSQRLKSFFWTKEKIAGKERLTVESKIRLVAVSTGPVAICLLIGAVLLFGSSQAVNTNLAQQEQESQEVTIIDPATPPEDKNGAIGLNKGDGGGSKPKQERPGGGGGGGREDPKPASKGKTPQASLTVPQVVAPDPNPPKIKNPELPVAATVVADPMLVPPDPKVAPYGDPKSKSTDPSSGPGTGNGIGTGRGGGIGPGEGGGIGPGRGGNIGGGDYHEGGGGPGGGDGGFSGRDVNVKVRILSKPEPQYTEDARKNQVTGTVVLIAIFDREGKVRNITTKSGLPYRLTEQAIEAAKRIKFTPAIKNGKPVNQWLQLEYNFNLY